MSPALDVLILRELFGRMGRHVSGAELAAAAGVSRAAIWKHLEALQAMGYPIEAQPHHGYRLLEPPDVWCADEILARLPADRPRAVAWRPVLFRETSSTNDLAAREAQAGAPEGLAILADHQTRGRGRQGRKWESAPGAGLYCSLLLRPAWPVTALTRLTIFTSVALAEAIEETARVEVRIKWPNDLLIDSRKVAGILTEVQADPERIHSAVVGFGINVNQRGEDFPGELGTLATSLRAATESPPRRADLLLAILRRIEHHYAAPFGKTGELWRQRCVTLGKPVTIRRGAAVLSGTAIGLDEEGSLLLRTESGATRPISAGDID